jgi:hypothetical protein
MHIKPFSLRIAPFENIRPAAGMRGCKNVCGMAENPARFHDKSSGMAAWPPSRALHDKADGACVTAASDSHTTALRTAPHATAPRLPAPQHQAAHARHDPTRWKPHTLGERCALPRRERAHVTRHDQVQSSRTHPSTGRLSANNRRFHAVTGSPPWAPTWPPAGCWPP